MGRRSTVDTLPDEQFEFVMDLLMNNKTDREVELLFAKKFPGRKVPKSSLHTWRNGSGSELVERYKITRFLARTVVEKLKADGIDVDDDRYKHVIEGIEDQLITKTREIFTADPMKLLYVRQEDEKMRIKREQIELNRQKLEFDKQKHEREASVRLDRLAIAAEVWKYLLFWANENEPHVADALTRRSGDILTGIEGHIENEAA